MAQQLATIPQKILVATLAINSLVMLVGAAHSIGIAYDQEKLNNTADQLISQNSIHQNSIGFNNGNQAAGAISSSFGIATDERMLTDTYVLAFINFTYTDETGSQFSTASDNAKYGEGKISTVVGKLVHVTALHDDTDNTACHSNIRGTKGRTLPPKGVHWIALIKRGRCNFEDKVKHAYAHHAAGVIVYNDKDSLTLDKMKINDKDREYEKPNKPNHKGLSLNYHQS